MKPMTRHSYTAQPAAIVLVAAAAAAALLLAWLSVGVNIKRSCVVHDTPYLALCPSPAPDNAAQLEALRARITANPGDANAYVQLARASGPESRDRILQAAARLAPTEPNIVLLQVAASLQREDWAQAVPPLVQLVEYRHVPVAAQVLARLIAGGQGHLLLPHIKPGSGWLAEVLTQMQAPASSFSAALPLVAEALKVGVLGPDAVRGYVRQLKSAGAWADAYSLWLVLQGKSLPALANGGFDTAFVSDGFDWEIAAAGPPSRAGAIVERRGGEERGAVLDVRLTGRSIATPMIRQYLFLGPGRYRLRGEYMSRQLRMEQGLAWNVHCTASKARAGGSPALGDTNGAWQPFAFEFSLPDDCGLVASLQLETFVPTEAALGGRGRVAFDALSLEKLAP
jgi:hypothetical protein